MATYNGDWRSPAFRQKVIFNIDEALKKSSNRTSNAQEIEQHIFQRANSRENYMTMLARIILAFSAGQNKGQVAAPVSSGAIMDTNIPPTSIMNQDALRTDNNQSLANFLKQPSPIPTPSPATGQSGLHVIGKQAKTPQTRQAQVSSTGTAPYPSPSPIIPSPSPAGHSPAPVSSQQHAPSPSSTPATRGSGIPSVESPGSFNPPSNPGSQESPVKLSDKEEQLYVEKLRQLSVYTEPLRKMIAKMHTGSDEDKDNKSLTKLKRLLSILGNSKERVPLNVLLKVETVLCRMFSKPTAPSPIGQSLLQALNAKADSPQSNNTLYRMFAPTLATIHGPPICPPIAPTRRREKQNCETRLPQVVQSEIAHLADKFTVGYANDGDQECERLALVCSINDKTLPAVPSLSISIPQNYPYSSPCCDTKDYESTEFLKKIRDRLQEKLSRFPRAYSLATLLLNWESCVRYVNARHGETVLQT